ncbi:MAG TPA: hypothetical protein PKE45_15045 [Caldilineaceae bacterium]|nr:hypothetical protein [Caldilineaceae bacterium]
MLLDLAQASVPSISLAPAKAGGTEARKRLYPRRKAIWALSPQTALVTCSGFENGSQGVKRLAEDDHTAGVFARFPIGKGFVELV